MAWSGPDSRSLQHTNPSKQNAKKIQIFTVSLARLSSREERWGGSDYKKRISNKIYTLATDTETKN